jgi:hypothetical protein
MTRNGHGLHSRSERVTKDSPELIPSSPMKYVNILDLPGHVVCYFNFYTYNKMYLLLLYYRVALIQIITNNTALIMTALQHRMVRWFWTMSWKGSGKSYGVLFYLNFTVAEFSGVETCVMYRTLLTEIKLHLLSAYGERKIIQYST